MINEANNSRQIYLLKKDAVIKQLQDRDYTPINIEDPDLTNFS